VINSARVRGMGREFAGFSYKNMVPASNKKQQNRISDIIEKQ